MGILTHQRCFKVLIIKALRFTSLAELALDVLDSLGEFLLADQGDDVSDAETV